MYQTIRWKLEVHSELVKFGLKHNILSEVISREYRKNSYNTWLELPRKLAFSKGFVFSEGTPPKALREIFLEEIYNISGFTPAEDQVIIDVGANYGDSAIWWANTFKSKVIAFEPLKDVFGVLEENIRINNANVTAYNVALGNGDIIVGSSEGYMFSAGGDLNMRTEKLDNYSFERVDLLKIDVEGFELEVLKGAENTIRKFNPRIIIETHSKELRRKCHEFLMTLGYRLKVEGRTGYIKAPGMDRVTNLFYST